MDKKIITLLLLKNWLNWPFSFRLKSLLIWPYCVSVCKLFVVCFPEILLEDPPVQDRERTLDRLKRKRKLRECLSIIQSYLWVIPLVAFIPFLHFILFLVGDVNVHSSYLSKSKLFITSLVITEYSISNIKLLGTDLFPLKFPLYNRIFI